MALLTPAEVAGQLASVEAWTFDGAMVADAIAAEMPHLTEFGDG